MQAITEDFQLTIKRTSTTVSAADQESILSLINDAEEIIRLNVGGHRFETTMETLLRRGDNHLYRCIKEKKLKQTDGAYFVDRDGLVFAVLLDYLRTGSIVLTDRVPRAAVERDATFYGLNLGGALDLAVPAAATAPHVRNDGIYLSTVSKVIVGFFLFGPAPEPKFMHQTTNPLHNYARPYTVDGSLIQWSLGGIANEEQHAVIASHGSSLIADHVYAFVPFAPPVKGAAYRILSKHNEDVLNPEIMDSLGDDNYKKIRYALNGKQVILGEIIFHDDTTVSIKALAKRFSTPELLSPPPITLEERATHCGVSIYRFASEEFQTGLSWMDTKQTKRYHIEVISLGDAVLMRSVTVELNRASKGPKWVPSPETQHNEVFLLLPRARPNRLPDPPMTPVPTPAQTPIPTPAFPRRGTGDPPQLSRSPSQQITPAVPPSPSSS